jgi:hypothetical protein
MKLRRGCTSDPVIPNCRRQVANGCQILSKGTKSDTVGFDLQTIVLFFHNYAMK